MKKKKGIARLLELRERKIHRRNQLVNFLFGSVALVAVLYNFLQ